MSISQVMSQIAATIEALPAAAGDASWTLVRSAGEVERDKCFAVNLVARAGPQGTGIDPRVAYALSVELVLRPGDFDYFADQQRLADETSTVSRALEGDGQWSGSAVVLPGGSTFLSTDVAMLATLELQVILREASS